MSEIETTVFRDLPGIRDLERLCKEAELNRLMVDERGELILALERKSLELFGISFFETQYHLLPRAVRDATTLEQWEANFEALDWDWEETPAFWQAVGIDVTDDDGDPLVCIDELGRPLICALKRLLPHATLTFRSWDLTAEQNDAAAEAWGKALLRGAARR